MCPCKIHKDSSELWIMWSSVTERLIVESPSWRINPSQRTQTLQLPRVCIKRRIRQINPRYKRWCDAAEIICERSPSIKCTAEMLIDEGAESKQQSRGSFINAKQKAAAAPRICSSAESESVRSCCGTHVGMCPACVSVLHPQGSLVHFWFFFFFWADLLSSEKMSLSSPHWVFTFLVWGTGSRFLGLEAKRLVQTWVRQKQESAAVMLEIQIDLWVWMYTNRKKKGSRVSKMSEYGLYLKIIQLKVTGIILNISMHIVVVFECRVDYLYLWRTISKAAVLEYLQYTQNK